MREKPSVGRIVHFYNHALAGFWEKDGIDLNGTGAGPYPAVVIQDFPGPYSNLLIHAYGGDWREGSVSEYSAEDSSATRYWVWPPRV
jgi:hypothetical protein